MKHDVHKKHYPKPNAKELADEEALLRRAQEIPPTLRLAFTDKDFLLSDSMRPMRLFLELEKAEQILKQQGIDKTIVVFGSARILSEHDARAALHEAEAALKHKPQDPHALKTLQRAQRMLDKSKYYQEAQAFGRLVAQHFKQSTPENRFYIATGGGPGIMEAANRGAHDEGVDSVGLTIALASEFPNIYSSPHLTFQFHYFAIRKMHLLLRARALVIFPGGYGTLDELFETLMLIQTKKMEAIPVILIGKDYWQKVIHFEVLEEEGMVSLSESMPFQYAETAQEAFDKIMAFYELKA